MKIALVTAPVLRLPNFDHQFVVTTDARDVAIGAILQQDTGMVCSSLLMQARSFNKLKYAIQRTNESCWGLFGH